MNRGAGRNAVGPTVFSPYAGPVILDAATIPDLQARMAAGTLTAVELTEAYLARIQELEPKVNSILFLDPSAVAQARASDERRRDGGQLGPMDGIPVLLKDNIDTHDLPTTAGSRALLPANAVADAPLVRRLRAAGAVILGKTNLSEWANFRSTKPTSGWSAVGGQTNNPHVLDRNPSGSSSGSAVAVAASLAQVSIGTETDGSIVSPGGVNGIVGLKPSVGVIDGGGIVPISREPDTAGPFARHVVDAAITLSVLAGRDYGPAEMSLRGKRIGVWTIDGAGEVWQQTLDTLGRAGAILVDVPPADQDEIGNHEWPALITEFQRDLHAYLATRPGVPQTLDELIAFNRNDPVELSRFGQELFEQAQAASPTTDPTYRQQRATATELARGYIDGLIAGESLDAIVAPTNGPAWPTDYAIGDVEGVGSSTPAAVAGYPNITVPAGFVGALPVGVSFMAEKNADARLLALAAAFERVADARRAPQFLPHQ
ncbi:MAG TPA: amidase family protein [Kutzneria sp.]|nr:amidase family protein [Kutzneria sp.]